MSYLLLSTFSITWAVKQPWHHHGFHQCPMASNQLDLATVPVQVSSTLQNSSKSSSLCSTMRSAMYCMSCSLEADRDSSRFDETPIFVEIREGKTQVWPRPYPQKARQQLQQDHQPLPRSNSSAIFRRTSQQCVDVQCTFISEKSGSICHSRVQNQRFMSHCCVCNSLTGF